MSQSDNPYLTITLTGRAPVKIKKENWPILASAESKDYNNEHEFQASRKATWKITVRVHADGRVIVYAVHKYQTQWQGEADRDIRAGMLRMIDPPPPDDEIVAMIQHVGAEIESRMPEGEHYSTGVFPRLVHECIADLPAVELDEETA